MKVSELHKTLNGVPDDMSVLVYDDGYLTEEVSAGVVGVKYFLVG